MDFPSATIDRAPTVTDAGLDALLLDIQVLSALLFGDTLNVDAPRPSLTRERAA